MITGILIGISCSGRRCRLLWRQQSSRLKISLVMYSRIPCAAARPKASPYYGEGCPRLSVSSLASGSCGGAGGLLVAINIQGGKPAWGRTFFVAARPVASPYWGEGRPRLTASS